jgi:hypothetical protein
VDHLGQEQPRAPQRVSVDCQRDRELMLGDRRLTVIAVQSGKQLDLGGDDSPLASTARIRVTFTPSLSGVASIHIKGLNCFVAALGARVAAAVDVSRDTRLLLVAADRQTLGAVQCSFGEDDGADRLYHLDGLTLALAGAPHGAALLDIVSGRELLLLHPDIQPSGGGAS